jgi:hypothetical protein
MIFDKIIVLFLKIIVLFLKIIVLFLNTFWWYLLKDFNKNGHCFDLLRIFEVISPNTKFELNCKWAFLPRPL